MGNGIWGKILTNISSSFSYLSLSLYRYSSLARWPTYRGFDSFYGYLNGFIDPFTKTYLDYFDLHSGENQVDHADEIDGSLHTAFLFQAKVEEALSYHNANHNAEPMFLYYATQLMHWPYNAPSTYTERCAGKSLAKDESIYCSFNLMLDEAIANLTCALSDYGMLDNTVFILASDNGGEESIQGDSYPFRGHKYDFNRGGLSANAFITSTLIPEDRRGSTYAGQMHVVDWLPTIMNLVTEGSWTGSYGGNSTVVDGVDMWDAVVYGLDSPRHEMVHFVNRVGRGSYQYDMYKLDSYFDEYTLADFEEVSMVFPEDYAPDFSYYSCSNPTVAGSDDSSSRGTSSEPLETKMYDAFFSIRSTSLYFWASVLCVAAVVGSMLVVKV